jgi:hypothetical protein
MKRLEPITLDRDRCWDGLAAFKLLLDQHESGILKEQEHVLPFFREHRDLAALIGYLYSDFVHIDRIAYEFDVFGDHAADLVVGDSQRQTYVFVEFEGAEPRSIFCKQAKKDTLAWGSQFERGYSQIIDWFWKLDDLTRTDTLRHRFEDARSIRCYGLLVIGRKAHLQPLERQRLAWRRDRVVVDSKPIKCVTFDELYEALKDYLNFLDPESASAGRSRPRTRGTRGRAIKKPDEGRS